MSISPVSGNEDRYVNRTIHYVVLALHSVFSETVCAPERGSPLFARLRHATCYKSNPTHDPVTGER